MPATKRRHAPRRPTADTAGHRWLGVAKTLCSPKRPLTAPSGNTTGEDGADSYVEESYASDLLAAGGGVGYLLKDRIAKLADLSDALARVVDGAWCWDPEVVSALFAQRHRRDPLAELSPREHEVLALMAEGRTNTAIGRALVVTQGAVESTSRRSSASSGCRRRTTITAGS